MMNIFNKTKNIEVENLRIENAKLNYLNNELNNKLSQIKNENNELSQIKNENNELNNKLSQIKNENNMLKIKSMNIHDIIKLNIVTPDFQRDVCKIRIKNLQESIIQNPNFIQPLIFGKIKEYNYIIDGQHRFNILQNLINCDHDVLKNIYTIPVVINDYTSLEEMKKDFESINDTMKLSDLIYCNEV